MNTVTINVYKDSKRQLYGYDYEGRAGKVSTLVGLASQEVKDEINHLLKVESGFGEYQISTDRDITYEFLN